MAYWVLFIAVAILSAVIQRNLNKKIEKYDKVYSDSGMSGSEVAERMLRDNGIHDVSVTSTEGYLTDHFNPADQTVNLSEVVYSKRTIAAIAIAAHECGHAVQHAEAYAPLNMRSKMVPVVTFASKWVPWILLGGMLLIEVFPALLLFGIILFASTTIFSFVTLPVEVDASRRAILWLEKSRICNPDELPAAKDALHAAAYTYVAAALGSLATLLYYALIFLSDRD